MYPYTTPQHITTDYPTRTASSEETRASTSDEQDNSKQQEVIGHLGPQLRGFDDKMASALIIATAALGSDL